jgi:hypothetical protein
MFYVADYVDPSLHGFQSGVQEQELLSRKSSASSTASLDRHEIRYLRDSSKRVIILIVRDKQAW